MNQDIRTEARRMGSDDFYGAKDDVLATRKADANRMYGEAYQIPVDASKIPDSLIIDNDFRTIIERAAREYNLETGRNLKLPKFDEDNSLSYLGAVKDIDDLKFWDLWQRYARDLADGMVGPGGSKRTAKLVHGKLRRPVVDLFDEQTTVDGESLFKNARAAYRQSNKVEEALVTGRDVLRQTRQDIEEVERLAQNMSDDEKAAFLTGALRELRKKVEGTPETANSAWNIIKSPEFRQKVEAVIGDQAKSRQFIASMNRLVEQNKTFNMVQQGRNSITSDMANQQAETARALVDIGGDLAQGNVMNAARGANSLAGQAPRLGPIASQKSANVLFGTATDPIAELYNPGQIGPYIIPGLLGGQATIAPGAGLNFFE
jgi:hypothetical protein